MYTEVLCSQWRKKPLREVLMRGVGMMLLQRRFYQVALLIVVAGLVTNCSLLWGEAVSNTATDGIFGLTLWVSQKQVSVGQPVAIRYTVDNFGDRTEVIQLEEKQEPVMDILVFFGPLGSTTTIYWSDGREITPEMRRLELAPGESKTIEMTWIPDKWATNESVRISGILNRERMHQDVSVDVCVGSCYLGH